MDNVTMLSNLINPQVMADMISAELESDLQLLGLYRVDRTLVGRAGDTITVPTWTYIGEAEILAENEEGTFSEMDTEEVSYTVKKAVKNILLTDEAVLSGYGDPMGEAVRQLRLSVRDRMDSDGVELLRAITADKGIVSYFTKSTGVTYETVVDGLYELGQEQQALPRILLCSQQVLKNLRKSGQVLDVAGAVRDRALQNGVVSMIAGAVIIVSNKLVDNESFLMSPGSLTAFLKRDVMVESQRNMLRKGTIVGADVHYVVAIENYNSIVAFKPRGATT